MSDTPPTDEAMTGYYDCPEHLVKRLEGICGKLERELAEASDIAKKYEDRYFAVKTELDEVKEDFFEAKAQLTAHKVALTKSYNILEEIVSSPFYQRTCRGGEMERLMNQAIKHLTSVNPNQPSQ